MYIVKWRDGFGKIHECPPRYQTEAAAQVAIDELPKEMRRECPHWIEEVEEADADRD